MLDRTIVCGRMGMFSSVPNQNVAKAHAAGNR